MTTPLARVAVLLLGFAAGPVSAQTPEADSSPARLLWQQGQDALRAGRTDEAMRLYQRSLALDPNFADDHLSLAAAYLDRDDGEHACDELGRYLQLQPRHVSVRAHYAELLLRLGRARAARVQWEQFDADAQDQGYGPGDLVHCHSRLMEIALREGDAYSAHLHHGIGLYLLARQQEAAPVEEEGFSPESLLCKAAGELVLALDERPDEARPCWYLFQVWSRLGQRQPAGRWLRAAADAAPCGDLTPAERRGLEVAERDRDAEARRK